MVRVFLQSTHGNGSANNEDSSTFGVMVRNKSTTIVSHERPNSKYNTVASNGQAFLNPNSTDLCKAEENVSIIWLSPTKA